MNQILDALLNGKDDVFGFFDQVYLFGSSLGADAPNDIDLLLVYEGATPEQVHIEKERIVLVLADIFVDCSLDFTTLSKSELRQTDFLTQVPHLQVKG